MGSSARAGQERWSLIQRPRRRTKRWRPCSPRSAVGSGVSWLAVDLIPKGKAPGRPTALGRSRRCWPLSPPPRCSGAVPSAHAPGRPYGGLGTGRERGARVPRGPRQAQLDGFDLHANVWMPARNRAGLERLCRYLLRPPLAQERLRLRADGRIVVELRKAWRDGTTHVLFEPIELLEKLAALTPRPETHLLLYHGVLAPHAAWRRQVARFGEFAREDPAAHAAQDRCGNQPRGRTWAALMGRAF